MPNSKGKGKQESLDHVPVDVQEAIILEDLLYVLMVCMALSFSGLLLNHSRASKETISDFIPTIHQTKTTLSKVCGLSWNPR